MLDVVISDGGGERLVCCRTTNELKGRSKELVRANIDGHNECFGGYPVQQWQVEHL